MGGVNHRRWICHCADSFATGNDEIPACRSTSTTGTLRRYQVGAEAAPHGMVCCEWSCRIQLDVGSPPVRYEDATRYMRRSWQSLVWIGMGNEAFIFLPQSTVGVVRVCPAIGCSLAHASTFRGSLAQARLSRMCAPFCSHSFTTVPTMNLYFLIGVQR